MSRSLIQLINESHIKSNTLEQLSLYKQIMFCNRTLIIRLHNNNIYGLRVHFNNIANIGIQSRLRSVLTFGLQILKIKIVNWKIMDEGKLFWNSFGTTRDPALRNGKLVAKLFFYLLLHFLYAFYKQNFFLSLPLFCFNFFLI